MYVRYEDYLFTPRESLDTRNLMVHPIQYIVILKQEDETEGRVRMEDGRSSRRSRNRRKRYNAMQYIEPCIKAIKDYFL